MEAYCTLLTNDRYLPGAAVLAHSLRDVGVTRQLVAFVAADCVSESTIDELKKVYDSVIPIDRIVNKTPANLYLMNRPDLIATFTKIQLWQQLSYSRLLYIDADVVALRSPEELFQTTIPEVEGRNHGFFAAVPDIGWPDCFNSGVMLLQPNMGDYYTLLALAQRGISFDGADQGLLNMHFQEWHRLSFAFNCTPSGNYQYVPAYRHFQSSISLVHFIGPQKPWQAGRHGHQANAGGVYEELLNQWWSVYDKHYRIMSSAADPNDGSIVRQYVFGEPLTLAPSSTVEPVEVPPEADFEVIPTEPASLQHDEVPQIAPTVFPEPQPIEDVVEKSAPSESSDAIPAIPERNWGSDWDPLRQPPPQHSRPEAAELPSKVYNMSSDGALYRAPVLPGMPSGLFYQIPSLEDRRAPPKPIFPWEKRSRKPSRVFADDPLTDDGVEDQLLQSSNVDATTTTTSATHATSSFSPSASPKTDVTGYSPRSNAWDEMPEIDRYVSTLPIHRKAKVHVLFNQDSSGGNSPTSTRDSTALDSRRHASAPNSSSVSNLPHTNSECDGSPSTRRSSAKITDFPTESERPSLPVTPAPIRRPAFWRQERDAEGDLPAAEGVPDQNDWDPAARLAELSIIQGRLLQSQDQDQDTGFQSSSKTTTGEPTAVPAVATGLASIEQLGSFGSPGPKPIPEREMPSSSTKFTSSPQQQVVSPTGQRRVTGEQYPYQQRQVSSPAYIGRGSPGYSYPDHSVVSTGSPLMSKTAAVLPMVMHAAKT